jgi:hypothetical protein
MIETLKISFSTSNLDALKNALLLCTPTKKYCGTLVSALCVLFFACLTRQRLFYFKIDKLILQLVLWETDHVPLVARFIGFAVKTATNTTSTIV